ncbi:MAG: tRNA pseudouridine(55) synthase TruB [Protaetiibacter sp.]
MSTATGVLLLDKPQGPTSHDLVARARRVLGTRKVGHAGTLDPMATGLMILGVGSATRLLNYLVGLDKEYLATIRLGVATGTDDAEGEVTAEHDASGVTDARIADGVAHLTGAIEQVPSSYSAVKVDGRRAYERARAGEEVALPARPVTIHAFEVLAIRRNGAVVDLEVRVECSSGTYIRALARDLGAGLGVGGHLTALRRTRVGPFAVADAVALPDPREHPDAPPPLEDPAEVAAALFPVVRLDAAETRDLAHGKRVELDAPDAGIAAALTPDGRLAALVELRGGRARVLLGLPSSEVLP